MALTEPNCLPNRLPFPPPLPPMPDTIVKHEPLDTADSGDPPPAPLASSPALPLSLDVLFTPTCIFTGQKLALVPFELHKKDEQDCLTNFNWNKLQWSEKQFFPVSLLSRSDQLSPPQPSTLGSH